MNHIIKAALSRINTPLGASRIVQADVTTKEAAKIIVGVFAENEIKLTVLTASRPNEEADKEGWITFEVDPPGRKDSNFALNVLRRGKKSIIEFDDLGSDLFLPDTDKIVESPEIEFVKLKNFNNSMDKVARFYDELLRHTEEMRDFAENFRAAMDDLQRLVEKNS